jgi:hypothetical protein
VKKFFLKFFPISKVQDLRRQVLTFEQGETVLMNYLSKARTWEFLVT